ncbi:hypothetical protein ACIBCP_15670 [Streptomyces sp. NPDC051287]|uniref:hypothetical protein n=1 Tax=Streptomyces sp. NPDC051287 TaxID=3365648 RepID=UPI00379BCE88
MSTNELLGATLLPGFVDQLLAQTREPREVPDVELNAAAEWLPALADAVGSWLSEIPFVAGDGFYKSGYAHLPLPGKAGRFLRVPLGSTRETWPIASTSALLTLAGSAEFEMYATSDDARASRPQYMRLLGPGDVLAVHVGTLCTLRSLGDGVQVLALRAVEPNTGQRLSRHEQAGILDRARQSLKRSSGGVR